MNCSLACIARTRAIKRCTAYKEMPMKYPSIVRMTLWLLLFVVYSASGDADSPTWNLDGFGTLGVVHSDEDQADFTSSFTASEGAGHTDRWSAKVDSKVGVQLTSDFAPRFRAVLQVISEQDHNGSFDPKIEWANVSYALTPELTIRVGRTILPAFMSSEYRKVGYAMPSARPEPEVYDLLPVTSSDGINITYQTYIADVSSFLHLSYGQKSTDLPDGFVVDAKDSFAVSNTLVWRDMTLFASYTRADLTVEALKPVFDGFREFGPEGEDIADRFDIDNSTARITSVGGRYDPGDWFFVSEWARNRSRSLAGDHMGWYVTGGVRVGALTPYLTVADLRVKSERSHPGLPHPQAQPLNEALNMMIWDSASDQSRIGIGARWDFAPGLALKAQYDRIELRRGTPGVLSNIQSGFEGDSPVSLFSATVDFVF